jgi:hypothetical protein
LQAFTNQTASLPAFSNRTASLFLQDVLISETVTSLFDFFQAF